MPRDHLWYLNRHIDAKEPDTWLVKGGMQKEGDHTVKRQLSSLHSLAPALQPDMSFQCILVNMKRLFMPVRNDYQPEAAQSTQLSD